MNIRRKDIIDKFIKKHANAKKALQRWLDAVEQAQWTSHADIKTDFPSADYVGNGRYVFNISGNNYRVAAVVIFIQGLLSVRFVGTHAEYNEIDCKTI